MGAMPARSENTGTGTSSVALARLNPHASALLDLMRGLAAAAVLISHLRGLFFVSYGEVVDRSAPTTALYFMTSLGHEAVVVFFVLSGYFISRSVLAAMTARRWSWGEYLVRRSARLYIVLIPALILGFILDETGMAGFGSDGPYGSGVAYHHIVPAPVIERLSWPIGLGNAAFLQGVAVPSFGSNGALWSLSYEFWFYMMFPCLVLILLPGTAVRRRIVPAALLVAMAVFVGKDITSYFLVWLLGTVVVMLPTPRLRLRGWLISLGAAGAICLTGIVLLKGSGLAAIAADLALAVPIALLVYVLVLVPGGAVLAGGRSLFDRIGKWTASFSYSLYLVHLPMLVFLHAAWIWYGGSKWQPDGLHFVGAGVIAVAVLCYAWGVSRLTEAHTERAANYVIRLARAGKIGIGQSVN
jgi:peptidoglycan/LPS O-acetylase OafA/YrhL